MFHDRDEFVHFVGYTPKKVHLLSMFARLFGERDVPSITYWGALIHTHCHVEAVSADAILLESSRLCSELPQNCGLHAPGAVAPVRRGA